MLVHAQSVSETVDAINAAFFDELKLPVAERKLAARWLAGRQGLPGAYGSTFAGFEGERKSGIVLFTGERIASASARHILGEEASRALRLLRVADAAVTSALSRADEGVHGFLARAGHAAREQSPGWYCCGKCTVGLWRNLLSGGLDRREERLHSGVRQLRAKRAGASDWRRFPFWYTVLALQEIDLPDAKKELAYAAPLLERAAQRKPAASIYAQRRHRLAERALARLAR